MKVSFNAGTGHRLAILALVGLFCSAALCQQLPVDLDQLSQLSPDQRMQAMQLLGRSQGPAQSSGVDSGLSQNVNSRNNDSQPSRQPDRYAPAPAVYDCYDDADASAPADTSQFDASSQGDWSANRGAMPGAPPSVQQNGSQVPPALYSSSSAANPYAGIQPSMSAGTMSNQGLVTQRQFQQGSGGRVPCSRIRRGTELYGADYPPKPLRPFGYDIFSAPPSTFAPATDIPIPADYVLGPGDTLRVQLYGASNTTFSLPVSRDGEIAFPKLGPISVAGQRFEDVRQMLQERVGKEMIGTQASISLGELRSMRVFLLGDVNQPGSYTVSSLSTMTNALLVGGGVSLVGSLRSIQLKRNGQVVRTLDLYDLLLHGDSSRDVRMQPGDVIFVPPVGSRVSIAGEVKRPAIYELHGESKLQDVIDLAGGLMASTSSSALEVRRYDKNQKKTLLQIDASKPADLATRLQDGDWVQVRKLSGPVENHVRILGFVRYPGDYEWFSGYDLRQLLASAQVLPSQTGKETYLPLGLIERTNPVSGVRSWLSFEVGSVINGNATLPLRQDDVVAILSRDDVAYLGSKAVRAVASGDFIGVSSCPALRELASTINSERSAHLLSAFSAERSRNDAKTVTTAPGWSGPSNSERVAAAEDLRCPPIFFAIPSALPYLLDQAVTVYGEVVRPGLYPIAANTPLEVVLETAGGRTNVSDLSKIEFVSYDSALQNGHSVYQHLDYSTDRTKGINPGDILSFKPLYLGQEVGTVTVGGEFRFPGTYGILHGERLSELMQRAGGVTESAYVDGAIFTRLSAMKSEKESYQRAAKDLQESLVTAVTSGAMGKDAALPTQFITQVVQQLQLAPAIGRVVVDANPASLKQHPEIDPILDAGDSIFMPKRPIFVTVIGQVLNPGSLQYKVGQSFKKYVDGAGGYTQGADEKRTFLILPNGSTRTLKESFWAPSDSVIPPGSMIVVPRDATPFNLLGWSDRIFGVVSQLAITAAALNSVTK